MNYLLLLKILFKWQLIPNYFKLRYQSKPFHLLQLHSSVLP
ncbi:hypothetical protein ACFP3I_05475 [Chryseobacterium arachidis]